MWQTSKNTDVFAHRLKWDVGNTEIEAYIASSTRNIDSSESVIESIATLETENGYSLMAEFMAAVASIHPPPAPANSGDLQSVNSASIEDTASFLFEPQRETVSSLPPNTPDIQPVFSFTSIKQPDPLICVPQLMASEKAFIKRHTHTATRLALQTKQQTVFLESLESELIQIGSRARQVAGVSWQLEADIHGLKLETKRLTAEFNGLQQSTAESDQVLGECSSELLRLQSLVSELHAITLDRRQVSATGNVSIGKRMWYLWLEYTLVFVGWLIWVLYFVGQVTFVAAMRMLRNHYQISANNQRK